MDKAYFDYDFEVVEKPEKFVDWVDTIKTDEEVQDILSIFGLGNKTKTTEEIQKHIIDQIKED